MFCKLALFQIVRAELRFLREPTQGHRGVQSGPENFVDSGTLIKQADKMMYAAKKKAKSAKVHTMVQ